MERFNRWMPLGLGVVAVAVVLAVLGWWYFAARANDRAPASAAWSVVGSVDAVPLASPASSERPSRPGEAALVVVYVAGAVEHPGVYRLAAGARVDDAVRAAGGLRASADPLAVNLAAPLRDGSEIAIRERGVVGEGVPEMGAASHERGAHQARRAGRRSPKPWSAPPSEQLDLNLADEHALAGLPGIGPELATRIVAFRSSVGRFDSLDGLADVNGMTARRLAAVAPYLTVK